MISLTFVAEIGLFQEADAWFPIITPVDCKNLWEGFGGENSSEAGIAVRRLLEGLSGEHCTTGTNTFSGITTVFPVLGEGRVMGG